jgi:hypothetical protein
MSVHGCTCCKGCGRCTICGGCSCFDLLKYLENEILEYFEIEVPKKKKRKKRKK